MKSGCILMSCGAGLFISFLLFVLQVLCIVYSRPQVILSQWILFCLVYCFWLCYALLAAMLALYTIIACKCVTLVCWPPVRPACWAWQPACNSTYYLSVCYGVLLHPILLLDVIFIIGIISMTSSIFFI